MKLYLRGRQKCQHLCCISPLNYLQLLPEDSEEDLLRKYTWAVAMSPIAQMIFAPIIGYLNNKLGSLRIIILISSAIFITGNLLYSIISVFPSPTGRYAALLISRFLTGASAG